MEPSRDPIQVTDHCVIRYLERAMGLNIEIVREHILAICSGAAAYGAVSVRAEGLRFEIAGNRIVTVTPDRLGPNRTGRALAQEKMRA